MRTLQVTMLGGHRGVGKTSLLAAMYDQFEATIKNTNLQLTPDVESAALLQERVAELKGIFDRDALEVEGGVEATDVPRSFRFGLGKKAKKPSLEIEFRDYPGGYLNKGTTEQKESVVELVRESQVAAVVIDTPALMERGGRWHDHLNRPQLVYDVFKKAYQDLDEPRLVLFVPLKCERYVRDRASAVELLAAVQKQYERMLEFFNSEALRHKVAVVVTPVQTAGELVFGSLEVREGEPVFRFRKTGFDAKYNPKYSEQPLRYMLRFLLRMHMEHQRWPVFNFLREFFGSDDHLREAIRVFAADCVQSRELGFAVLQGERWLRETT